MQQEQGQLHTQTQTRKNVPERPREQEYAWPVTPFSMQPPFYTSSFRHRKNKLFFKSSPQSLTTL